MSQQHLASHVSDGVNARNVGAHRVIYFDVAILGLDSSALQADVIHVALDAHSHKNLVAVDHRV